MENIKFFENIDNNKRLTELKKILYKIESNDAFEIKRNNYIYQIIDNMEKNSIQWDNNCQINIKYIGNIFFSQITNSELTKESLDLFFAMTYRFLIELYLSIKNDLSMEFEKIRNFANDEIENFYDEAKIQIKYANIDMPIRIFKDLNNSEVIGNLKDFKDLSENITKKLDDLKNEYDEKEKRVVELKNTLDKYETSFNFVGLYDGFNKLWEDKEKERKFLSKILMVFGFIVLLPFFVELYILNNIKDNLAEMKELLYFSIVPSISITLILIYYFKILLQNYKSIKLQIMQLELRKTLCQFIQSYVEYSTDVKTSNEKNSLEKFENIIFSAIVSDDEKLPSTFDGMEQINSLIKSIKN